MTNGEKTSEYKLAQSASIVGSLTMLLGIVITCGTPMVESLVEINPTASAIAGAIVTIAGAILKALTTISYNNGRVATKTNGKK